MSAFKGNTPAWDLDVRVTADWRPAIRKINTVVVAVGGNTEGRLSVSWPRQVEGASAPSTRLLLGPSGRGAAALGYRRHGRRGRKRFGRHARPAVRSGTADLLQRPRLRGAVPQPGAAVCGCRRGRSGDRSAAPGVRLYPSRGALPATGPAHRPESYGWKGCRDGSAKDPGVLRRMRAGLQPCPTPTIAVGRRRIFPRGFESALWTTDGTAAGTARVTVPEGGILEPAALGRLGDDALVLTQGGGLWSSDGSPEGGSRFIAQLPFNPNHPERFQPVFAPAALGASTFLFRRAPGPAGPGSSMLEVWRTDGTAAGTLRLIRPLLDSYSPSLSPVVVGAGVSSSGSAARSGRATAAAAPRLPAAVAGGTFALAAAPYPKPAPDTRTPTRARDAVGDRPPRADGEPSGNVRSGERRHRRREPRQRAGRHSLLHVEDPRREMPGKVWLHRGHRGEHPPPAGPAVEPAGGDVFTVGRSALLRRLRGRPRFELWSPPSRRSSSLVRRPLAGSRGIDPEILAAERSLLFAATGPATAASSEARSAAASPSTRIQSEHEEHEAYPAGCRRRPGQGPAP